MKAAKKYTVYLLITCISYACATKEVPVETMESSTVITESILNDQFKTAELTNAQLHAFEQKSLTKLKDFVDYANLLKDPEVDPAFKAQSRSQLENLLVDKTLIINIIDQLNKSNNITKYQIIEPKINMGLRREMDHYEGEIDFKLEGLDKDKVIVSQSSQTIRIHAVRQLKSFGGEDEQIWEVLLSPVNFDPPE